MQRFAHQADIALRQIPHAAMHQLGGARARAFGKVMAFKQGHFEAARRRIQRCAQAGRAAADDGDVKMGGLRELGEQVLARSHTLIVCHG